MEIGAARGIEGIERMGVALALWLSSARPKLRDLPTWPRVGARSNGWTAQVRVMLPVDRMIVSSKIGRDFGPRQLPVLSRPAISMT